MLLSEMPKYGKLIKVVQDIFEHVSTCFLMEQHPHHIYDIISLDLSFFRSTFTIPRPYGEPSGGDTDNAGMEQITIMCSELNTVCK